MANWIAGAINPAHKGKLHEDLRVAKGKKIPRYLLDEAAKRGGAVGREARLALTLRGLGRRRRRA